MVFFIFILLLCKFSWVECQDIPFDRKILQEAISNSLEFMYADGSFKPTYYTQQEVDAWVNFNTKILKAMDWNLKKHSDLFLAKELEVLQQGKYWLEIITNPWLPREVRDILQWSSYHSPKIKKIYQDVYYIYMGG